MEIIPAILSRDFSEIEEKVALIKGLSKIVQIDICDGKFVPSTTWPYRKTNEKIDENFEKILHEDRGMPEWETVNYEFDLMIENPTEDDARKWLSAGAERIVLHFESSKDLNPVISVLGGLVEMGMGINVNTNPKELEKYVNKIQFIQCMGIRKIGFQGQDLDPSVVEKVKEIKAIYPGIEVSVDGGITLENAVLLKHAGADRLVIGSALFNDNDELNNIVDTYSKFKQI
jgi:ribulose-phosphate 3-epimerase